MTADTLFSRLLTCIDPLVYVWMFGSTAESCDGESTALLDTSVRSGEYELMCLIDEADPFQTAHEQSDCETIGYTLGALMRDDMLSC